MKIRYSYRNSGPWIYKECVCTLTLPADEMAALLHAANCGLAIDSPDNTDKGRQMDYERRLRVIALIHEIETRREAAKKLLRTDVDA